MLQQPPGTHYTPSILLRRIRHKEYRRALGTHYGQTRRHQAGYSPCHRRDGRAGITVICISAFSVGPKYHSSDDYGSGRLQPTPSEGRQSWHYYILSSLHLTQDPFTTSDNYGPDGAVASANRELHMLHTDLAITYTICGYI